MGDEETCVNGTRDEAEELCNQSLSNASQVWVDACADDVCAGGEDMALHTTFLVSQAREVLEEIVEREASRAHSIDPETPCHTCAPGDQCFNDVQWALEVGIPTGYYQRRGWSPMLDASSCFEEVQATLWSWQQDP